MRTRRLMFGSGLGVIAAATVVALTAYGQDRPVAEPKYYQGKVSPAPPGMFPGTTVKQGGQAPATLPPTVVPTGSKLPPVTVPLPKFTPSGAPPIAATPPRPARITQPVIAGPAGVQQVNGMEPITVPPPSFPAVPVPSRAMLPPPTVVVESSSMPNPLPPLAPVPVPTPAKVSPSVFDPPALRTPEPVAAPTSPKDQITFPAMPEPTPQPTMPLPAPAKQVFADTPTSPLFAANGAMPVRQAPSVTVEFVAPESVSVGQVLVYELLVRNVGTSAVANVRVEDELPTRCALVSTEPVAEAAGERLAWSLGTLEAGVERRIKISVKPGEEGELRSRAAVSFAAAVDARIKVTRPKIGIAIAGIETARVGDKVSFQIQLSNTGTGPAGKIQLQARFSEGLLHTQGSVIEAELAGLPAGQTKTLALETVAVKGGPQTCMLTASADGGQPETAKASVNLVEPMLVVKQSGPSTVMVRSEAVYQLELSNPGSATTDPVQIVTTLPTGFDFVQATDSGNFAEANRSVSWKVPGIAPGQSKTIAVKVRSSAPSEGVVRTAAMTVGSDAAAPSTGIVAADHRAGGKGLEARAETPVKAEGIPALRFEVSDVDDPVEVGKEAVYEIRLLNQGTGPCTNVQIVAELSEGTSAAGATGPTTGRVTGQQIVFDPIPQFGMKGEAVFRVRVRGDLAGDHRFRVRMACDQVKTPVTKEENTRFYKP